MNNTVNKLTTIMQQLVNLHMIFVEDGTIYIKNWDVYQNLDKLEKNQGKQQKKLRERLYEMCRGIIIFGKDKRKELV